MSNAIITFKLMPESPETDMEAIAEKAKAVAKEAGAKGEMQHQITPIAFGLKELKVLAMFEVTDDLSSDSIADKMAEIEGVNSAEVAQMDLAMG